MDNPRPEKVAVVDEVRQHFDDADAAILTEYRGLKVKDLAGLRRTLRASGGEYKIYKNTLVRLAARESGLAELEDLLVGPTGITFVNGDAAAVAKVLRDYARTNPLLVIKGGVLGDKVIGATRDHGAGRAAVPRGAAGPAGRRHGRPAAAVRRPPPGPAPQPGLRPGRAARPAGEPRPGGHRVGP